jgi:hypothetical protein
MSSVSTVKGRASALFQPAAIIVEVAGIGLERIFRRAALGRQHVEKSAARARASRAKRAAYFSFAGGSVCDISRGCGSTNVANANMPA